MSDGSRRYRLVVDSEVAVDLIRMRSSDRAAYDELQVFFEDLQGDADWCRAIADPAYSDHQIESVEPFWHLQEERKNAYRIKFYNVAAWRVITAADHRAMKVAILAIMHRDQDYERDKAFVERLRTSYESLGLANF